jgi:hypothetical protein
MPRVVGQLACLLCSIDPGATGMLLPVAQAGLLAAPLVFRREIRRTVLRLQGRTPLTAEDPTAGQGSDRSDTSLVDDDDPGAETRGR